MSHLHFGAAVPVVWRTFPSLTARALAAGSGSSSSSVIFPNELTGKLKLVLLCFSVQQHRQLNSWLPYVAAVQRHFRILHHPNGPEDLLRVYRLVIRGRSARAIRWLLEERWRLLLLPCESSTKVSEAPATAAAATKAPASAAGAEATNAPAPAAAATNALASAVAAAADTPALAAAGHTKGREGGERPVPQSAATAAAARIRASSAASRHPALAVVTEGHASGGDAAGVSQEKTDKSTSRGGLEAKMQTIRIKEERNDSYDLSSAASQPVCSRRQVEKRSESGLSSFSAGSNVINSIGQGDSIYTIGSSTRPRTTSSNVSSPNSTSSGIVSSSSLNSSTNSYSSNNRSNGSSNNSSSPISEYMESTPQCHSNNGVVGDHRRIVQDFDEEIRRGGELERKAVFTQQQQDKGVCEYNEFDDPASCFFAFTNKRKFLAETALPDSRRGYLLLLDEENRIRWAEHEIFHAQEKLHGCLELQELLRLPASRLLLPPTYDARVALPQQSVSSVSNTSN